MSNNALHNIRFFNVVYGAAKGSYIDQCVRISIHIASIVAALKILVGWFTNNFVNQVRFFPDKREIFRLVEHKISFLFTPKTVQRNHIVWLLEHNSSIMSDRAKWVEFSFCLLIQGIRIGNLDNSSFHHLRRKLSFGYERIIDLVMQPDFIENRFLPCHLRNDIVGRIPSLHGLKEQEGLFLGKQRLDSQSQFIIQSSKNEYSIIC